jgi:6-pyruvoyltetrahydropterin/6-carboxytetrahydropterin synthase
VTFQDRRWVFPADECRLLPLVNTTAELLAEWIGNELLQLLARNGINQPGLIRLEVDECLGQSAIWENVKD